ncbi:MAG: DUF134 domain-containing protein [Deltaproteobacteria bacterium]|nr:DUF134 domain-containing protein [Deltaproteobacteria bacterium]
MARPRKPRQCGCQIPCRGFKPAGVPLTQLNTQRLAHDELEALKLCDLEGLTQEEAGERMGVSRGTVQRTLKAARAKVAHALVEGEALLLADE